VLALEPTWADKVTAIATAVSAVALLGAVSAAVFAGQQVREARRGRHAQTALEFLRRWDEDALVETRRLVAGFATPEQLAAAFRGYVERNDRDAYVLYRELDFFEQVAALEYVGALDFDLVNVLVGRRLVERWDMWRPSIAVLGPENPYPLFEALAEKMRQAVGGPGSSGAMSVTSSAPGSPPSAAPPSAAPPSPSPSV
jgi:hypothetical protein